LLVDLRQPNEFALAHIPGAVDFPLSTFDPSAIAARPGQTVVFSCRSGVRSLKAAAANIDERRDRIVNGCNVISSRNRTAPHSQTTRR
jgi:rhodanese-related sulfurtransferase